jgi:hypothetical protein
MNNLPFGIFGKETHQKPCAPLNLSPDLLEMMRTNLIRIADQLVIGETYIRVWLGLTGDKLQSEQLEIASDSFPKDFVDYILDSVKTKRHQIYSDYTVSDLMGGNGRTVWLFSRTPQLEQLLSSPIRLGLMTHLQAIR